LQHALYNGSFSEVIQPFSNQSKSDGLFVQPEADLIGVNSLQHFKLISDTELAMCNHHSRFILCERHQVLNTRLDRTCLGSLFLKSLDGAREHCKFVRKPLMETVYQVSPTQYIVFSPKAWTPQASCLNGTHFPIFLEAGNNRISLSPGCSAQLADNIITSDFDIRISPEPVQTLWDWDPLTFSFSAYHDLERNDQQIRQLHQDLKQLNASVSNSDHIEMKISEHLSTPKHYPWPWFLIISGIILSLLCIFVCYLVKCTNLCSSCRRLNQLMTSQPNQLPSVAYHATSPAYEATIPCPHSKNYLTCPQCNPNRTTRP
jgi:hypothetical protein